MLTDVDRIVLAVRERQPVVRALQALLGAEVVDTGHLTVWGAERTTLRGGVGEIEVLAPKSLGAVADFIGRRGPGLFAIGLATDEPEKFQRHLEAQAVDFEQSGGQLFLTSDRGVDLPGLNLVVTPAKARAPVGLLQRFCGATLLHRLAEPGGLLRILGGRSIQVSGVEQKIPGVTSRVIRLGHDLASHLAILAPCGSDTSIGRFFYRHGPGLYQASALTEQLATIRERLASLGHPPATPSGDEFLSIPRELLGGARLTLFTRAAAGSSWDLLAPLSDPESAFS